MSIISRLTVILYLTSYCNAFHNPRQPKLVRTTLRLGKINIDLKEELAKYLEQRHEMADEIAKLEAGQVKEGTKKNPILDYIGFEIKESENKEPPEVFDYSELVKYGFGYLVEPVMEAGGRLEMYKLMDMEVPDTSIEFTESSQEIVWNKDGASSLGEDRYKGLKMNTLLNDDLLGQQLQESQERKKESGNQTDGSRKNKANNKNTYWTSERIDEYAKEQGKIYDWARESKSGRFVKDPNEVLAIDGPLKLYSIVTSLFVAVAFSRSTTNFVLVNVLGNSGELQETLTVPALVIIFANVGSAVFNFLQAPKKGRGSLIWAMKGLAGGPLSITQLRNLDVVERDPSEERG
mmetsp:Transcript_17808/g.26346  ORF Transcript_17808/g.26346 Transcript_17808/m.26346 type:complete len:349 (+) Transcript_17808:70-1116(+)